VTRALSEQLAPPARPKRYVAVAEWPRNAQGKLNRALLVEKIKA
jgi:O-succinylbenzoic acid--CoA ligase